MKLFGVDAGAFIITMDDAYAFREGEPSSVVGLVRSATQWKFLSQPDA
jgi:hypothetical protein